MKLKSAPHRGAFYFAALAYRRLLPHAYQAVAPCTPVPAGTLRPRWRFLKAKSQEAAMNRIHAIALIAAGAATFGLSGGVATAQTVSGADPYSQGYAAGASAKQENNFDTFERGYSAGKTQADVQHGSTSADAYSQGYAAGMARADRDQQQAYNQGYAARGWEDRRMADRAYDNGFDAGADRRSRDELEFP
jgi:hypothetical protein